MLEAQQIEEVKGKIDASLDEKKGLSYYFDCRQDAQPDVLPSLPTRTLADYSLLDEGGCCEKVKVFVPLKGDLRGVPASAVESVFSELSLKISVRTATHEHQARDQFRPLKYSHSLRTHFDSKQSPPIAVSG